jgi:hypothetical protein
VAKLNLEANQQKPTIPSGFPRHKPIKIPKLIEVNTLKWTPTSNIQALKKATTGNIM